MRPGCSRKGEAFGDPQRTDRRQVRDPRQVARGGDGGHLQGAPPSPRRGARRQGHPLPPGGRRGGRRRSFPERGAFRDQAAPSERGGAPRLRGGRRRAGVHRHGAHRRLEPARAADRVRAAPARADPRDRPPVAQGARLPPPAEDRPPRHLAGQPDAHPGRRRLSAGQADRPRHRQGSRGDRWAHHHRGLPRQAPLRLAGALRRRRLGRAQRPLLLRRRPLRAAHRPAAVRRPASPRP